MCQWSPGLPPLRSCFQFFECTQKWNSRNEITELGGDSMFNALRKHHPVFHSSCPISPPTSSAPVHEGSAHPCQHLFSEFCFLAVSNHPDGCGALDHRILTSRTTVKYTPCAPPLSPQLLLRESGPSWAPGIVPLVAGPEAVC